MCCDIRNIWFLIFEHVNSIMTIVPYDWLWLVIYWKDPVQWHMVQILIISSHQNRSKISSKSILNFSLCITFPNSSVNFWPTRRKFLVDDRKFPMGISAADFIRNLQWVVEICSPRDANFRSARRKFLVPHRIFPEVEVYISLADRSFSKPYPICTGWLPFHPSFLPRRFCDFNLHLKVFFNVLESHFLESLRGCLGSFLELASSSLHLL
jgi:hypothetical protein